MIDETNIVEENKEQHRKNQINDDKNINHSNSLVDGSFRMNLELAPDITETVYVNPFHSINLTLSSDNLKNNSLCSTVNKDFLNDFQLDQMDENFTSRELVKLFVYLTITKPIDELSMKGIKYWENLSKDRNFNFLFSRYKPWTLHTSYKRLFTHSNVEEITQMLKTNPLADLNSLTNELYKKRKRKENQFLNKKTFRENDKLSFMSSDKQIKDSEMSENSINSVEVVIDGYTSSSSSYKKDKRKQSFPQKKLMTGDIISSLKMKRIKYFNKQPCFKTSLQYLTKNVMTQCNQRDSLSDEFDNIRNIAENKIFSKNKIN